jgi:hypothetical protein
MELTAGCLGYHAEVRDFDEAARPGSPSGLGEAARAPERAVNRVGLYVELYVEWV